MSESVARLTEALAGRDPGAADGLLYYVMPYIEGDTLRTRLDRERQLPIEETMRLITLMAGALDFAHARGVVHRDLKPENILLRPDEAVELLEVRRERGL